MSILGKRTIFVGPADDANHKPLNVEGIAISATPPGTVMERTAAGLLINANLKTVFDGYFIVADKDQQRSKSVDDNWTINENMVAIQARSGEFLNVLVATAQVLIVGTPLTRNGAGLLIISAVTSLEEQLCVSEEALTTSGTQLVRVRVS